MARLMELLTCLRCEDENGKPYEWLPRVPNPKRCPHCMSPLWNKARKPAKQEVSE